MRIAYLSLDEVNRFLMQRWARRGSFQAIIPSTDELGPPADGPSGIVIDFDYLTAAARATWLAHLLSGAAAGPVLIHGHNITDAEQAALRRRGVAVCRGRLVRTRLMAWLSCAERTATSRLARGGTGFNGKT